MNRRPDPPVLQIPAGWSPPDHAPRETAERTAGEAITSAIGAATLLIIAFAASYAFFGWAVTRVEPGPGYGCHEQHCAQTNTCRWPNGSPQ